MPSPPDLPGLIVAAPRSGAGKTTVSLGLMRALTRRGVRVQPFKCGPDYIDPAFHARACNRDSFNLDTWAMRPGLIARLIADSTAGADIAIAEGVMGLHDGAAGPGQAGSGATADLARLTGWPVLLVIDVTGQAATAAAIALGCRDLEPGIALAGVVLNRLASDRQLALIAPALARIGVPILGILRRNAALGLPERHLGLVQAAEHDSLDAHLDTLADALVRDTPLDALVAAASPARLQQTGTPTKVLRLSPPGQRIALARDTAFSFIYPHIVDGWRQAGAEIVPFSPLADEALDAGADAVWLPGGYPELHAGRLAANATFAEGVRKAARRGAAIHGECGGYMVLGQRLIDAEGDNHAMLGLLGLETSFATRRLHLGYRRAGLLGDCALGRSGARLFGHEFHYATVLASPDGPLADVTDAAGVCVAERGSRRSNVTGSFFHVVDRAG